MRSAFEIPPGTLGSGPLLTAWGQGSTLAVVTSKRQVALLSQDGIEQHSFGIDSPNIKGAASNKLAVAAHKIAWSSDGAFAVGLVPLLYQDDNMATSRTKRRYNPCCPSSRFRFYISLGFFVKKGPEAITGRTHSPAGDVSGMLVQRPATSHDWYHKRVSATV